MSEIQSPAGKQLSNLIARTCAAIAAALGFLAIAGWILELPLLASLRPGWIPMAPSTALLLVLFGIAVFFSAGEPPSRIAYRAGVAIGSAGVLIGLCLFFLSYLGIRLEAEYIGFAIAGSIGDAPFGHMSPATALCFLAAGMSLVASLSSSPDRSGLAMAGFWLAGLVAFASAVFLLAYLFGAPLLYGGPFIPPALTTSIALAALAAALLALAGPRAWAPDQQIDAANLRASGSFVLVFALMTAGLVTAGAIYYRNQVTQHRAEIERQLSAIAELKAGDLMNWRAERIGDATLLHRNAVFAGLVRRALGVSRNARAQDQLHDWLRQIREAYGYDKVSLIDAQGVARISIPEAPLAASELERARRALRSGKVSLEDFHRDEPGGAPHLSLLVPILDAGADAGAGGRPLGIVTLEINPGKYLYPFIERWPVPSRTAETLLVRRDGNDVLFLNQLRFRKNTALSLRFALTRTELPAVKAALGQEGIVDGTDYRGVPVIAALRAVPGTPWFLVARIDTDEFLASVVEALWLTATLVGTLLLSAGAALGLIWRHQRVRHYKERSRAAEALAAGGARYRAITQTATDAIVVANGAGVIVGWNAGAERIFGYSEAEALGESLTRLMPQRYREDHLAGLNRVQSGGQRNATGATLELHGLTKTGNEFPLELSLSAWETSEGRFFTGIVRNVSERKRAEKALARQKDLLNMLSQTNQTIVRITRREELFPAVCRAAVEFGRFHFAWIGLIEGDGRQLKPVTHHGGDAGYVQQLRVSTDATDPTGGGPAGQAFRTGQHAVSNDFLDDPASVPWREGASRAGVRALAAFPIRERGATVGVMVVSSGESGFFTDELLPVLDEIAIDISFALDNFERRAELVRATEALREHDSRYRAVVQTSTDGFWAADSRGRLIDVNDSYARRSGYSREELLAMKIGDLDVSNDGPVMIARGERVMKAGGEVFESVHRAKDGSLWPVDISTTYVPGARGQFLSFIRDITERKRNVEALRLGEMRLRGIFSQAPVGIATIDSLTGRYLQINPRYCAIVGRGEKELLETTFQAITHPEDRQQNLDSRTLMLQGRIDKYTAQKRYLRPDGAMVWANLTVVPMWADAQAPRQHLTIIEDITERKRLEEMHLQAQKLESLGTLAGGIAHDFNNILAAIKGNADLAAADVGPDHPAAESLREIRKASERAGELVRRITTFARPMQVRHEEMALGSVVAEVLKLLRSTLPAAITLSAGFGEDTPRVRADAGQVHEAIVNLTTNAAHAIGPRPGTIEYRLEPVEVRPEQSQSIPGLGQGRYVCLTVADDGCGMDAATMARIFDAFYTTKPLGEGTGLGLSMVHGIMKGHGGAVTVESAPGEGSSFRLYFPAAGRASHKPVAQAGVEAPRVAGQRVLYIDDEEALVSLARRGLSRLGHSIHGFTDPKQALAAFRAAPWEFDIVVTDLSMPHMSGFDLAREVTALRPGMPVLLTTGHIRAEDESLAREAGVRELVLKPFTVDELDRTLDRVFRDAR